MTKDKITHEDARPLRGLAELRLQEQQGSSTPPQPEQDVQRLIHELQVHQIELEMQNEELKLAQEEIEIGLTKYTDLYNSAPVGYLTLGLNGTILHANLTAANLLGVERLRLANRRFGNFICDESHPAFNAFLAKVFESEDKQVCEVAIPKAQGQPLYVRIEATADKEKQECRAALLDITDRKRAEEMQTAKNAAEATASAKDRFLAALSHELRTPLTPVLLIASSLEKRKDLPADVLEKLATLHRNLSLEARLIDDLLDLTRIVHGKMSYELRPHHACDILTQTVEMFRPDIDAKHLHVTVEIAAKHCGVLADQARLQQVFWNLLNNAIKFTPPKGHITARAFNGDSGRLFLQVSDTGIGFQPNAIPCLFNAFEQATENTYHTFGGLGLGLAIAKAIVEQHCGSIRAESPGPGRGATFTVELPVDPEADKALAQVRKELLIPDTQPSHLQTTPSILVVDDHSDTAEILSLTLRAAGYEVMTAYDAASAKQLAANNKYDLVISDLGLPDISGLDLMKHLKRDYGLKGIALTGYGTEKDRAQSREAGFVEHLVKPIDLDQLEALVPRVLNAS